MYRVTIQLEHGCKVEFVEPSILRAAVRVEEYHDKMVWCDIHQMEEGEDYSKRSEVDQDNN